jgi:hypothetical protein
MVSFMMSLHQMKYFIVLVSFLWSRFTLGSTSDSDSIEVSSFIRSKVNGKALVYYTHAKINKLTQCHQIQFINYPNDTKVADIFIPLFIVLPKRYNNQLAWSNGKNYVSYVEVGDAGTWIVGTKPGVDDGFAYIRPKFFTLTPIDLERDVSWKWSINSEWTTVPDMRLICTAITYDSTLSDKAIASNNEIDKSLHTHLNSKYDTLYEKYSSYYDITYFDQNDDSNTSNMILLPASTKDHFKEHSTEHSITIYATAYSLQNPDIQYTLSDYDVICTFE